MPLFTYYGVKVYWYDGRKEIFRYATAEQAESSAHQLYVGNMRQVKYAIYLGRRFDWKLRELRLRIFG